MISSKTSKAEAGEPSSYEQIEQALSKASSKTGEDTQETDSASKQLFMRDDATAQSDQKTSLEPTKKASCKENSGNGESVEYARKENGLSSLHSQIDESSSRTEAADALIQTRLYTTQSDILGGAALLANVTLPEKPITTGPGDPESGRAGVISEGLKLDASCRPPESFTSQGTGSKEPPKLTNAVEASATTLAEIPGSHRVIHTQLSNPRALGGAGAGQGAKSKVGTSLRRGKWTMEEEAYVARVIQDFNSGFLNAPAGTTLRSYLSEKLQCDPMRITKKFTGDACIGKRVFHPAVRSAANAASIDKAQAELDALERRWRRRLEMQQRESAKKAAASAATSSSPGQGRGQGLVQGVPLAVLGGTGMGSASLSSTGQMQQHAVAQAASWLDRANAILKGSKATVGENNGGRSAAGADPSSQAFDSMPSKEIESQMKEVQRLIYEGPMIKKTTAGLQGSRHTAPEALRSDSAGSSLVDQGLSVEPADKRMRTATHSGAEDAEALVGFLRSVRAAASQESS